jgi:hypothetical protein
MPTFFVERYLPGCDRAWLESALARLKSGRGDVTYLGSTYVPSDESCFCRFEAATAEAVRAANAEAGVPFARIVAADEIDISQANQTQKGDPFMKRTLIIGFALAAVGLVATASAAGDRPAQGRALHVTKECSEYDGTVGSFCTITSSNVAAIEPGMKVVYLAAPVNGILDSDIALSFGNGGAALGHVLLNFKTAQGHVTFSVGTGRFRGFRAEADVSVDPAGIWHWDGLYNSSHSGADENDQ